MENNDFNVIALQRDLHSEQQRWQSSSNAWQPQKDIQSPVEMMPLAQRRQSSRSVIHWLRFLGLMISVQGKKRKRNDNAVT